MVRSMRELTKLINYLNNFLKMNEVKEVLKRTCGLSVDDINDLVTNMISCKNILPMINIATRIYRCLDELTSLDEIRRLRIKPPPTRVVNELKRFILDVLISRSRNLTYLGPLINFIYESLIDSLKYYGYKILIYECRSKSRIMIGRPNIDLYLIFETGTKLHHVFGIPYLPASSIKGAFRSYVNLKGLKCKVSAIGLLEVSPEEFLFGTKEFKGSIVFFDAFPRVENKCLLEPEVTTPIYADGTETPRLREHVAQPVPVIYHVIARNVVFKFIIGIGPNVSKECQKALFDWFNEVLNVGIGAKTTLGYGLFSVYKREIGD